MLRRRQHLRLAGIAFATLPEAIRGFRKQRRVAGGQTIAVNNFVSGRAVEKVVVNRLADFGAERRRVAQRTRENSRILPAAKETHRTRRVRWQRNFYANRVRHPHIGDGRNGLAVDLHADQTTAITVLDEKDIITRVRGGESA